MGMDPEAGPGLVFKVLPEIFRLIPGGTIVGAFFFILLSIAALTSTISLLEVATAYLVDEKSWIRKRAVWVVAAITVVLGIPSVLSQEGMVPWLEDLPIIHKSYLGLMDWLFGNIMLGVGAVFISIFMGWVWKRSGSTGEILNGYPGFGRIAPVIFFLLRFFCPIVILLVIIFIFRQGV
jgi:NSS family neurotransmitter:Na+ symporter